MYAIRSYYVLDVPAFAYTLAGPHVTPDLIVVLELRIV